jgi:hypothetical protein
LTSTLFLCAAFPCVATIEVDGHVAAPPLRSGWARIDGPAGLECYCPAHRREAIEAARRAVGAVLERAGNARPE